jgi:hypothetical protein
MTVPAEQMCIPGVTSNEREAGDESTRDQRFSRADDQQKPEEINLPVPSSWKRLAISNAQSRISDLIVNAIGYGPMINTAMLAPPHELVRLNNTPRACS